jgi:hypothetical protein
MLKRKKIKFYLPTKRPGAWIGGAGLIMLVAGAKNSSVTATMVDPRADDARSKRNVKC